MVRTVAAHRLEGATASSWPSQPLAAGEWSQLVALIERQRLWSLLADALSDGTFPGSEQQIEETRRREEDTLLTCLYLDRTLVAVADLLSDIDFRVFKGVASASLFYPEVALRTYSDIDMLVPTDQFDRAAAILVDHGATRHNPDPRSGYTGRLGKSAGFTLPGGWEVDVHRSPQSGPFGVAVVAQDLFAHPTAIVVGNRSIATPSVPAHFLAACYHAILPKDERRLVPLRDVAQILVSGDLDDDEVMAMADRWRGSLIVATAVVTATTFFGLPDTTPLVRWAQRYVPQARERRWLRAYHDPRQRGPLVLGAYTASAFPSHLDGARYLYAQLFHEARDPLKIRAQRLARRLSR